MDLRICADCAMWVNNRDDSGVENDAQGDEYRKRRDEGLEALGGHIAVGVGDGFTHAPCDICGQTGHHGIDAVLIEYAVLIESDEEKQWQISDVWKDIDHESLAAWEKFVSNDAFAVIKKAFDYGDSLRVYREPDSEGGCPTTSPIKGNYSYFTEYDNCYMYYDSNKENGQQMTNIYVKKKDANNG